MPNLKTLRLLLLLKLGVVTILIVCVAGFASIFGSEEAMSLECPTVKVTCPKTRRDDEDVKFGVKLQTTSGNGAPSYKWTLSAGSIKDQEDERRQSVIMVDAHGVGGGKIIGTVTVNNVGPNCNVTDYCETKITGIAQPNSPPTISGIGASPSTIVICPTDPNRSDPTTIQLTVSASDPDNDKLSYFWSVTGGRRVGEGSSVRWDLGGLQPGEYTAKIVVSDSKGIQATAFTKVTVDTCK